MVSLKKRAGTMQEFDKVKLKTSLVNAGAKEEHAAGVVDSIAAKVTEGMATQEVRRLVAAELRGLDQNAAQKYETFQKQAKTVTA
jgi:transcriptional regulator NrdR family protein